jgi:PIN domain nuclease of toxin-antitoxin system
MKLLLDSHTFIWLRQEPHRLSIEASTQMLVASNRLFLSTTTLWELQIKIDLGKLSFSDPLYTVIEDELHGNDIELLHIDPRHIFNLANLPFHHRDPFDRLIISQAFVEDMAVVTMDRRFPQYGVKTLW